MQDFPRALRFFAAALALVTVAGVALAVSGLSPATPLRDTALQLLALALLLAAGMLGWRALRRVRDTLVALERSETRHRAIIEGAGEAIVVIDDRASILTFNRAAERMF